MPRSGKVSLWFDGEKVVDNVAARTYLDQPAFIQIGILRDTINDEETLYLDEAFEGSSFDDVALTNGVPPPRTAAPSRASKGCSVARTLVPVDGLASLLFGCAAWALRRVRRRPVRE